MLKKIIVTSLIAISVISLQASELKPTQSPAQPTQSADPLPFNFAISSTETAPQATARAMQLLCCELRNKVCTNSDLNQLQLLFSILNKREKYDRATFNQCLCTVKGMLAAERRCYELSLKAATRVFVKASANGKGSEMKRDAACALTDASFVRFKNSCIAVEQLEYLAKVL